MKNSEYKELSRYVNDIFDRFKSVAINCKGKTSFNQYKEWTSEQLLTNAIKPDADGIFVRENANDRQKFFACLVVYIAVTHTIINKKKSLSFVDVINSHYKLKRSIKARYGEEFEELFVYLRNLLFYGNKIMNSKIVTKENIEKWKLIGVE